MINTMSRHDNRQRDAMREISLTAGINPYAEGSCLIKYGRTEVMCTASLIDGVPRWLKGTGQGWLTAEYGMLPRATHLRKDREAVKGKQEGRTVEIQRFIGRSLRSVTDLRLLNNLTMWLDCDVMVADGGTRTAAITGSWVAAAIALKQAIGAGRLKQNCFTSQVAAVSCGIGTDGVLLDLDYSEDAQAAADGNFVVSSAGHWVEIQVSAEKRPFSATEFSEMQRLAHLGTQQLFQMQRELVEQY